jgi:uncharacterized membrane protein YsdA (DUF1294 family)
MNNTEILTATAIVYAAMSVLTAIAYGWDKLCAKRGWSRVPEMRLHLLSLFGGWPGALVAQQVFRHKSSKKSFRAVFFLTVVLNCLVLGAAVYAVGTN